MNNDTLGLSLIPAKVRLYLYVGFGVAGLAVSSTAVYFTAVGSAVPAWVGGVAAVLGGLAAPFGAMAGSNVTRQPDQATPAAPVDQPLQPAQDTPAEAPPAA